MTLAIEESVVGAVLQRPDLFNSISKVVAHSSFNCTRLATMWRVISDQIAQGMMVSPLEVAEAADVRGELESAGGLEYMVRLVWQMPCPELGMAYALRLRSLSVRRDLLRAAASLERSVNFHDAVRDLQVTLMAYYLDNGQQGKGSNSMMECQPVINSRSASDL
jgi:replicative DNA helicase